MNGVGTQEAEASQIPVIDYEGSDYRQAFWGQGREYEDAIERVALRRLLPDKGKRIAEIGAGFGRLADLYTGYEQIVLFDYSRTLLADAVSRWGHDPRFVFVAGNVYELPLATGVLDTLVMARVMHHLADVPVALTQIERALHGASTAILEYANKRNLKAIGRWLLQKQAWSPFALEPIEFVRLNFDFHPAWMAARMQEAGLVPEEQLALSHFRLPALKRYVSTQVLVHLESPLLKSAGRFPLAPSVFVRSRLLKDRRRHAAPVGAAAVETIFRCPHCGAEAMVRVAPHKVRCSTCTHVYQQHQSIWDFKEPVS